MSKELRYLPVALTVGGFLARLFLPRIIGWRVPPGGDEERPDAAAPRFQAAFGWQVPALARGKLHLRILAGFGDPGWSMKVPADHRAGNLCSGSH